MCFPKCAETKVLVYRKAETLALVKAKPLRNTLGNLEAEVQVNTLAETLLNVETRQLATHCTRKSRSTSGQFFYVEDKEVVDSKADTLALVRADTLLDSEAYKLAKVMSETLVDILSDLAGKILVNFVADTVAEVEVEKLGNTAGDVQTREVVEMHDDMLARGGRENSR